MNTDYTIAQKVIHWLMALLIMLDLFVAQKFGNFMALADRLESRADHGSLGIIIALLFLARIYLRFKYGAPSLPDTMPHWQKLAAATAHWTLYFLIACLITTGILTAINAANPVALFGSFDITIGQMNEATFDSIRQFHELTTNAIIALIVVHIVAAIYHWLWAKDQTTQKMLKFWKTLRD